MEQFIIYWALIVAPTDQGRVHEVFRTYEPCQIQVERYKSMGFGAACIPTNQPEIIKSEQQLRSLAQVIYGNIDGISGK